MRITLATKISATMSGVLLLAVLNSLVALLGAYNIENLMQRLVSENLGSVVAAEELEIALLEQRGFVSLYVLDNGNRAWLEEMRRKEPAFDRWLANAHATAYTDEEHRILHQVGDVFKQYDAKRELAVELFDKGDVPEAKRVVLEEGKRLSDQAYELCEQYLAVNQRLVDARMAEGRNETRQLALLAGVSVALTVAAGLGLLWLFFQGVLSPLRHMAAEARRVSGDCAVPVDSASDDELHTLGLYLRILMSDVAETRTHLERVAELRKASHRRHVGCQRRSRNPQPAHRGENVALLDTQSRGRTSRLGSQVPRHR
jgi:CHASE3 domain sensor protein